MIATDASGVAARYAELRERIAAACAAAGRSTDEVVLVGASKRQPLALMRAAFDAGLRVFGENQVQEAEAKQPELPAADWHLLGPLQSNKVKRAARLFSTVHAIDRPKIARLLAREAAAGGKRINGFLEVNLGDEPSKHGFRPEQLTGLAGELTALDGLRVVGLMALPPFEADLERARLWFRRLRELRDELAAQPAWRGEPGWLSMGMSHDFEAAILEGATHVRVGTALFGGAAVNFAGGFMMALLQLLLTVLSLYSWVIIIRALISWVSPDPYNPIVQILRRLTEPVLKPLRRLIPPRLTGGLDVSPILAILLIQLVRYTIIYSFSAAPRL